MQYKVKIDKFQDKEAFKKFLYELPQLRGLNKEQKDILKCKIVNTICRFPDWFSAVKKVLLFRGNNSEILIYAIAELALMKCIDVMNAYKVLVWKIFKPLSDYKWPVSQELLDAIGYCASVFYEYTTIDERMPLYERIGYNAVNDEVFIMAVRDCQKLGNVSKKRNLITYLLKMQSNPEAIKLIDRDVYLDFLSDAVICAASGISVHFIWESMLQRRLLSLIEDLLKEEFKTLCKMVKEKLPLYEGYSVSKRDWEGFLVYATEAKEDFIFDKTVVSFLRDMVALIPYLSKERFWKLAGYVQTLIGEKSALWGCLLNNDCVVEDRKFMLKALKAYLDHYVEDGKSKNHKLLIDVDVVNRLSLKQLITLASRSVDEDVSVRFMFTKKAFKKIRAKLTACIISGEICRAESKEVYKKFVSSCEVVS